MADPVHKFGPRMDVDDLARLVLNTDLDQSIREEALEWLARKHMASLLRRARGIARRLESQCDLPRRDMLDPDLATIDAFLLFYEDAGKIKNPRAWRGWLFSVVRNLLRQELSRRRVELEARRLDDERTPDGATRLATDSVMTREEIEARIRHEIRQNFRYLSLVEAVCGLSPALRNAVTRRYLEGRSTRDAAEKLGIERGALRVRLHRARKILMRQLGLDIKKRSEEGETEA